MRQIASIEIRTIVSELQSLVGCYLKKFYDLGDGSFRMLFSSTQGNQMLYIKLLHTVNKTIIAEEVDEPTNFAKAIRKRILGMKVKSVAQRYADRIITVQFTSADEDPRLIIEMFGKGNLILTNRDFEIMVCYHVAKLKEREISPHSIYQFPQGKKLVLSELGRAGAGEILQALKGSNERLIKELSGNIDIGPLYLEDIILASGMDPKSKASELFNTEVLAANLVNFIRESDSPRPRIYSRDGKYEDYSILPIRKYRDLQAKEFKSLSEALEEFYSEERTRLERDEEEVNEIIANIEKQKSIIKELKDSEKEYAEAGHKIFERMREINQMIDYIGEHRRVTLQELQSAFGIKIKSIDLKNKSVVIDL
ncbi:MAG: NFACT family protein [Candidatus Micrarchaeota archaeon]|nr:NFACT family protein [Candidatus Micrarchaeota archaeon]MDE1847624.1 NFACT family protein [Candidatus Micrarchaeota archaeon]MDE1863827.1 NFACT family protein [Candidatus Micrarchaeota archaeon]